jgi:hypothetical protein
MAEYIADGVRTAAPHVGDGGMNPVFATRLTGETREISDGKGHLIEVAVAPGSLPRTPNGRTPTSTVVMPQTASASPSKTHAKPIRVARVPVPEAAPKPKEGESSHRVTIASLFGNLFSGSKAEAETGQTGSVAPSEAFAKPKRGASRTASARTTVHPQPHRAVAPKVATAHATKPAPKPVKQAAKPAPSPPAPELRTAYSAPPAKSNNLLAGAAPVVPVGSFESRWAGAR